MEGILLKDQNRAVQYKNMINALSSDSAKQQVHADSLKASRMRSIVNSYYFSEAYKKTVKVAFTGEQFPNELLYAFKMISLNIETMAALFSKSNNVDEYLRLADEHHLSRDICSNIRSSYGIGLANCYPTPNVILANSHPCDGLSKLSYTMSKFYNCKFLAIDTPNFLNDDSVSYLADQLKRIIHEIEKELNTKFEEEEFAKVIKYSNEAKEYYLKILGLCQTTKLPQVSKELFEIVESNPWGLKELVGVCKMLYEEALEKSKKGDTRKLKRVLWVGQKPNYSNELVGYMEQHLEIFYLGALDSSHRIMLDPNDPYKSIAKRSIKYLWDPIRFRNDISDIQDKFGIDGVILLNAWGCRNMLGINQMLRDLIIKSGLKFLTFDIDYMDKDKYSFSQMKNRIDAFLEII